MRVALSSGGAAHPGCEVFSQNPSGTHIPSLKITELNVLFLNIDMSGKRAASSNQWLGSVCEMDQTVSMLCFA